MRHPAGYELIVMAALICCLSFSTTVWSAEPPSKAWYDIYVSRSIVPKLDSSAFHLEHAESFPDPHAFVMPVEKGFPDSASVTVVTSPDKTHALLWSPMSGEIDSDAYLVDLQTRKAVRVVQCGSPCIVELCAWLAPRHFVITAAWENPEEAEPASYHLRFLYFDLDTGILTHFRGPTLKPGFDQELSRAWCQWLIKRFPQRRKVFLGCL